MEKLEELIVELLKELDKMSQEDINEFRGIWLTELKKDGAKQCQKAEEIANALCDVAIDRARRKEKVA